MYTYFTVKAQCKIWHDNKLLLKEINISAAKSQMYTCVVYWLFIHAYTSTVNSMLI